MLAQMTSTHWDEWVEYMRAEPFDEERMDQRFGHIAAILMNRYRARGAKAVTINDVTLKFGDSPLDEPAAKKPKKSWQAMKAFAKAFVFGE